MDATIISGNDKDFIEIQNKLTDEQKRISETPQGNGKDFYENDSSRTIEESSEDFEEA